MGYIDTDDGIYRHEEADPADPGTGFSGLLNLVANSIAPAVTTLVAQALSSDADLRESLEQMLGEEISDLDLVQFSDPGIPKEGRREPADGVADRGMDQSGRVYTEVLEDGTVYTPKASVRTLTVPDGSQITSPKYDGTGASTRYIDKSGHVGELFQDDHGQVPAWVLARWKQRGGFGGGGSGTKPCRIIGGIGQSNAAKAAWRLAAEGFRVADTRLLDWVDGQVVTLDENEVTLGAEFGRSMLLTSDSADYDVLIVNAAQGSSGFTTTSIDPAPTGYYIPDDAPTAGTWDRTLTADPYNRVVLALAAINAALAAAPAGSYVYAILLSLGEADGNRLSQSEFAAKLDDLIAYFRAQLGIPDLPWIIGSITPEIMATAPAGVSTALADTPRRVARTGFVYGPAGYARINQAIHYSLQGQVRRGHLFATQGLTEALLNQTDGEPVPPMNLTVHREGGKAVIVWDRPWCHVDTLTVEYSTDAGTTWTAATIDGVHGSRSTAITVAPATTLQVRGTTTNAQGTSEPATTLG